MRLQVLPQTTAKMQTEMKKNHFCKKAFIEVLKMHVFDSITSSMIGFLMLFLKLCQADKSILMFLPAFCKHYMVCISNEVWCGGLYHCFRFLCRYVSERVCMHSFLDIKPPFCKLCYKCRTYK